MKEPIVDFDSLPWQAPAHGIRFKSRIWNGQQLRLLEFTSEFVELDWCRKGHIGYLLEGELEIDFSGRLQCVKAGQGFFIDEGEEGKHKARAVTNIAIMILVDHA